VYDAPIADACGAIDPSDTTTQGVCAEYSGLDAPCKSVARCSTGNAVADEPTCVAASGVWGPRVCQTGLEAKFEEWRYVSPVTDEGTPDPICGGADPANPTGVYNAEYVPGVSDVIEKCICGPCYVTMSDYENMGAGGGYNEYCNLHVCTSEGTAWEPSGGFAVTAENAGAYEGPESFKTFKEISDTLGVSVEVGYAHVSVMRNANADQWCRHWWEWQLYR
jgi:hypothetical protein